jgi:hypothetical protein
MYRVAKCVGFHGLDNHGGENRDIGVLGEPRRLGNGILCLLVDECSVFYDIRLGPDRLINMLVVCGFPEGVENAALKFTGCNVVGTRRQWPAQF